jgi:hypothetical protein
VKIFSKREWVILIGLVVVVLVVYGGLLLVVTRGGVKGDRQGLAA